MAKQILLDLDEYEELLRECDAYKQAFQTAAEHLINEKPQDEILSQDDDYRYTFAWVRLNVREDDDGTLSIISMEPM
jgi:hypothetical protein